VQKHQLGEVRNNMTPSSCIFSGIFLRKIIKIEQCLTKLRLMKNGDVFFDSRCRRRTLNECTPHTGHSITFSVFALCDPVTLTLTFLPPNHTSCQGHYSLYEVWTLWDHSFWVIMWKNKRDREYCLKPGFHYPSWLVTGFYYPSTRGRRPVNSGSGNRALFTWLPSVWVKK